MLLPRQLDARDVQPRQHRGRTGLQSTHVLRTFAQEMRRSRGCYYATTSGDWTTWQLAFGCARAQKWMTLYGGLGDARVCLKKHRRTDEGLWGLHRA